MAILFYTYHTITFVRAILLFILRCENLVKALLIDEIKDKNEDLTTINYFIFILFNIKTTNNIWWCFTSERLSDSNSIF